jgi:sucrose phosphorylase
VLDTHDGIGVVDVGADQTDPRLDGLLDHAQIDELVEGIHERSGGGSRRATGAAASNLDVYQVNCTYYDALGRDDRRYLLARALQLFCPGVPQVYYVGLLAGENDLALLERTGVGRDVNRHVFSEDEVLAALERPVVRELCDLIRMRNTHPAFRGEATVLPGPAGTLAIEWRAGDAVARLDCDLRSGTFALAR